MKKKDIDLPGFGKSKAERTNCTIEEYANDRKTDRILFEK
jgi:hypothetical protein